MVRFELISMLLKEGCLEILELARDKKPRQFKSFRDLKNSRTGRYYSQTSISLRLKDLVKIKALEKIIMVNKKDKEVLGYKITSTGLKILGMAYEFEDRLEKLVGVK